MHISFLIPTRNRPGNLARTLKSVVEIGAPDSEILVCDNSDPEFRRDNSEVISLFDRKVRLVATPRVFSQSENWRYLIENSKGEWLTLVTDRTVLTKFWYASIQSVLSRSQVLCYSSIGVLKLQKYYYIQLPRFSGECFSLSAAAELKSAVKMSFSHQTPNFLNSVIHRSVFDRILSRSGKVFGDISSDPGIYSEILADNIDWIFLDRPLMIMHSAEGGLGHSFNAGIRTRAVESMCEDVARFGGLTATPIPQIISIMNIRAHELQSALRRFGRTETLDVSAYCESLWREAQWQKEHFPFNATELIRSLARKNGILEAIKNKNRWEKLCVRAKTACYSIGPLLPRLGIYPIINLPVCRSRDLDSALLQARSVQFEPNSVSRKDRRWT